MQFLPMFEEAYEAHVAQGSKPTGMKVSTALWKELTAAELIVWAPIAGRFTSPFAPMGSIGPIPEDGKLPTYKGTFVYVETFFEDQQFELSPG